MKPSLPSSREVIAFASVGVLAAIGHYGTLIALVEGARIGAVPATLAGFIVGGVISYLLNRRHTWRSERPHAEATWRFALVAGVGFLLTGVFMFALVDVAHAPYLPAQVVTTGIVLVWTFLANRLWTFHEPPVP